MSNRDRIRRQVLRGLALNRTPGFHFPGNFLDVSFERVARDASILSIDSGPWCADPDGQTDLAPTAILADLAIGACIRAHLRRSARLATVSLSLQFTGAARNGRLRATAVFEGFLRRSAGRLGMGRVAVSGNSGTVCYGTGTFMALESRNLRLHPVPLRNRQSPEPQRLDERDLDAEEKRILGRADAALAARGAFIRNFWGGRNTLVNGLHVGNRVGHAQGGVLIGMAATNAAAALPAGWLLSGISALYVSPGEGRVLHARSKLVRRGRLTAVVRTQITGKNRRRVLEVISTHCARA